MAWYALKYSSTWTTKTSFAPSIYSGLADIESLSSFTYHAIFEQSYILLGEFTQVFDTFNVSTRGLVEYPDRSLHNAFCKDKTKVIYVIRGPVEGSSYQPSSDCWGQFGPLPICWSEAKPGSVRYPPKTWCTKTRYVPCKWWCTSWSLKGKWWTVEKVEIW